MIQHETTRDLLKGYSERELDAAQKARLITGLRSWYRSPDRDRLHGRCFEVILNRYIITRPLKLTEVGAMYYKSEANIGSDVREGIRLLSEYLPAQTGS